MTAPLCRHCCRRKVHRPRGLCFRCYYAPGVRDLYPPTSKFAQRGVGHSGSREPVPTEVPGGTAAKVAALAERAQRGESLFHAADAGSPADLYASDRPRWRN